MTPRPTDSTGEFEDFSDEVEELCRSELKKCLRVPEEQAPLKGLDVQEDLTYTEHPVKILETSERVTLGSKKGFSVFSGNEVVSWSGILL